MSLELRPEVVRLSLRDPFRIARQQAEDDGGAISTVVIELTTDRMPGMMALGEAFPEPYYGETEETILAVLPRLLAAVAPLEDLLLGRGEGARGEGSRGDTSRADDDADLAAARAALIAAAERMDAVLGHNGGAKCAVDTALHDLVGRRFGLSVHALLGLSSEIPPTDFTLGLDEPAVVAERAARAARFPALKIKVGGPSDLATLRAVRARYSGPIRVDANTGWTLDQGVALIPDLMALGVELIEQPFPAHRLADLARLQAASPLPIVADESAVTIRDLDGLVGVVAGVNVKLAKCGGPGPAARMLARARELGFRTFLGCMVETSVGIAASAAVASLADWVDLDGCLLLADEPFDGLVLGDDCRWRLGETPGLGVRRIG